MRGAEFQIVVRLLIAHARQRPGRLVLTILSTIAAACVVVWVVAGYDSLVGQFGDMGDEYMGRYDLLVLPTSPVVAGGFGGRPEPSLAPDLVDAIRRDPMVAVVDPVFETRVPIRFHEANSPRQARRAGTEEPSPSAAPTAAPKGPRIMGGMAQLRSMSRLPTLVGTDSGEPPHAALRGAWFDPRRPDRMEAAITADSAEAMGLALGDEIVIPAERSRPEARLKVVAILEQPKRLPPPTGSPTRRSTRCDRSRGSSPIGSSRSPSSR